MRKQFYYIHLFSASLNLDEENNMFIETLPQDSIFSANCIYTKKQIECIELSKYNISIEEVDSYIFAEDLKSNLLFDESVDFYLAKLNVNGIPMIDHFGIYLDKYLVVSKDGLNLLRKFGVLNAEADLLIGDIHDYFSNNKHLFWMPLKHREMFIKKFIKK